MFFTLTIFRTRSSMSPPNVTRLSSWFASEASPMSRSAPRTAQGYERRTFILPEPLNLDAALRKCAVALRLSRTDMRLADAARTQSDPLAAPTIQIGSRLPRSAPDKLPKWETSEPNLPRQLCRTCEVEARPACMVCCSRPPLAWSLGILRFGRGICAAVASPTSRCSGVQFESYREPVLDSW